MIMHGLFLDNDVIVGGDAGAAAGADPAADPQDLRAGTPVVSVEAVSALLDCRFAKASSREFSHF